MDFLEDFGIIKIFLMTALSFVLAISWTPLLSHFLYKYKMGKTIRDIKSAPIFSKLHRKKSGTPTMGGMLIWVTTLLLAALFWILARATDVELFDKLNFLTRPQTLLPLGALVVSAIIGLVDDYFNTRKIGDNGGGMKMKIRIMLYTAIAIGGAYWFFYKLDWDLIHVPFVGNFEIGFWYIPIFIFIIVATSFSVNESDGLDGLAGGVLLICFGAFGIIAFAQGKTDLATFCGVISGALLAFLWFNIPPARFFMGDTGSMGLGVTLGIVAMLTNYALLLPIIGLVLVLESSSVIIQSASKKFRKKKVFLSTPIHHHYEAIGWPESKIVMRFWVITGVMAMIGLVIVFMERGFTF
ncbi:MAG: phospho-N-acetylmuramoyl-pentapeptide-transferase [Patescibacteria group bacterium]